MRSNAILQKNSLFRDDLFKIDTSVGKEREPKDRAHFLIGYYRACNGKMDATKIGGKEQIPLLIGEGFIIVRTFFEEIDTAELYDLHYPIREFPTQQDYLKEA